MEYDQASNSMLVVDFHKRFFTSRDGYKATDEKVRDMERLLECQQVEQNDFHR